MSGVSPLGRALAILSVVSIAALVGLGWMADRYTKLVPTAPRPDTTAARSAALRELDQFLLAHDRLRKSSPQDRAGTFRDPTLSGQDFERLRTALGAWRAGRLPADDPYAVAFERRRERLGSIVPAGD